MTVEVAIKSAMGVAKELAEGTLGVGQLEAAAAAECRALFGQVVGEGDALWELQIEVARGVLAAGGIGGVELAEWAAVYAQPETPREPSWIETLLGIELDDEDSNG